MISMQVFFLIATIATVTIVTINGATLNLPYNIQPCICTKEYMPVCASNGISYPNLCVFECNNKQNDMKLMHSGPCENIEHGLLGDSCTSSCNHVKRYVCGSNGVTYENPCMFKCAADHDPSLKIKHMGPC